jgi:hypothetical protein
LKVKKICICEECGEPILNPNRGYIFNGTISYADAENEIALLVEENNAAYCIKCFSKKIGFPLTLERDTITSRGL